MNKYYLAIDFGASSGRHIVGYMKDNELVLDEVHRFPNGMKDSPQGLVWDVETLFEEVKIGIKKALDKYGEIESLAIDTWGVDYVLLNGDKPILPCLAYRNERNALAAERVHKIIPFKELYEHTGIQFAAFNTIYQLFDDKETGKLDNATDYLMIPEFFSYLLTGKKIHEYTNASTGGFLNLKTKTFDMELINKLGIPSHLFGELVKPGTLIGSLKPELIKEFGKDIKVVAAPSHDTASAFEAVSTPEDAVIISSGTWSLIGVKDKDGNNSIDSFKCNFTNEGGVGYIRYLKNIMGMWIVNNFAKEINVSVPDLVKLAETSSYNETFNANDGSLYAPKNMKEAIVDLLKKNAPKSDADIALSIFKSLALSYKVATEEIEKNLNKEINYIYIVGGGAKNKLLNKLTEEISGRKVVALPIEATAIGNIKSQIR